MQTHDISQIAASMAAINRIKGVGPQTAAAARTEIELEVAWRQAGHTGKRPAGWEPR